jgi:hypothetical protein
MAEGSSEACGFQPLAVRRGEMFLVVYRLVSRSSRQPPFLLVAEQMNPHTSPPNPSPARRALIAFIEKKARRFAASPKEGCLSGFYPRIKRPSLHMDDRLARVRTWNAELAWLYAVAEQDIQAALRWEVDEYADGKFRIIFTTADED